ncbi:unnamed protein product [Rotaria sordida]|uniref:Uncharacterized protein n=1 Tax=Rotaria sordida TaxID=392033 RepID=A0A814PJV8_9BILA|nr:unnamed protein product [Rotaria sordida]CAF1411656.1 unnamed protein product [Rotaria sordida]
MKLFNILIQYFLFNYFCYCHDLHHADQVIVKQSESSVTNDPSNKNIETTNSPRNNNEYPHDTVDTRFQAIHDLKQSTYESSQNDEQQIQSKTPSLQNQASISIENDLTSTATPIKEPTEQQIILSSTETLSKSDTIKNIPISNPKIIYKDDLSSIETQINSQTIDTIQQTLSSTQSNQQEHIKSISNHTPSSSNTQQSISNTINNSNLSEQHSQIPITTTTTTNDTSTVQYESHIPVSVTSKHHQNVHINSRHIQTDQQQNENIFITDDNQIENMIVQSYNDEEKHSNESLLESDTNLSLPSTIDYMIENETQTDDNNNDSNQYVSKIESKIDDNQTLLSSTPIVNDNDKISTNKYRQICWHLPKQFETTIELIENEIFRFINILPTFLQTILFEHNDDREVLMNTIWFTLSCTMCFLFSLIFLLIGTKRLKQTKHDREIRIHCQQLQQKNNRIELERATFERENQRLTDEIDKLKSLPEHNSDEDIFALREECIRFQEDLKTAYTNHMLLQQDIDYKQNLILKHEYDKQRQVETITYLNNEVLQLKQELEKERGIIVRLQSNDLSLERFEKAQEIIEQLKSEITQLKQEKFIQNNQLQELQEHANQLTIENNQLALSMKQLKDLFEQYDQTIKHIHDKINNDKTLELEDLRLILIENSSNNNQHLLSTIDNDIKKSNQHMRDLHNEIDIKTYRIKELDVLLQQEKNRCKEIETKLKVVLELRERDTHLHIRQLGQTDAELRKARTDTERIRILQQQLEFKQQQLDDVQKVLSTEQIKFNEECSKLQHDTHEKWMEVKRVTRELEASKKECESLRRQITKYAKNAHFSQEKTMIKPVSQHMRNSEELDSHSSSPSHYQQDENFRPIDYQHNNSGGASPTEMFIPRPTLFNLPRPPFFPPPFMPPLQANPFMMHPRFPMTPVGSYGIMSPMSHLITNGSDGNNSEIIDSSNITPNSTSYDMESNGITTSSLPDDEQQIKTKKPKKSLKKKTKTSGTTVIKEDV